MKNFYILFFILFSFVNVSYSQDCSLLAASCQPFESRCASTGKIDVIAINGSGTYNYRVTGPVSTSYSSSNSITGLPAGSYTVTIRDVLYGCVITVPNIAVPGSYNDPRFNLIKTDITCLNAVDGSISVASPQYGRSPFMYSIVAPSASGVGTTSGTGTFNNLPAGSYHIRMTDSCGGIQTRNVAILDYDWWISYTSVTKSGCNVGSFYIELKDTRGNNNYGTNSAVFSSFQYGVVKAPADTTWSGNNYFNVSLGNIRSATFVVKDACGNIKTKSWVDNNTPYVDAAVGLSNYTCATFTATITGKQNLTNPQFCIYDNSNTLLACNTTGIFTGLTYNSYCIKITDICYDTTFTRCFTAVTPRPSVASAVTIANLNCTSFDVSIAGQSNLFNPQYCLYDNSSILIGCNTTGVFTNVPVGAYCMQITSPGCYDTTITRCFTVNRPQYSVGSWMSISNKSCTDFTASVTGQTNFTTAQYCLYDNANVLLSCNKLGIFDNLAYGSYCITTTLIGGINSCYDTSMSRCFTVNKPVPSVSAAVSISNKTCADFTATVTGQTNLITPDYCLYSGGVVITCNSTGQFTNLAYGSYCIEIENGCKDTVINRCFTVSPVAVAITASAQLSCTINSTNMKVAISTGLSPFRIEIYDPVNTLVGNLTNLSTGTYYIDNLPGLPAGQSYKVMVFDACNNSVTDFIQPVITTLSKNITITSKCPGGSTPNGSSDVELSFTSNLNRFYPKIIKQDGNPVNTSYTQTNFSETAFTFSDLLPGTYIFESTVIGGCGTKVNDTMVVSPYQYPSLQNSSLYQCDNNGFSVGAAVVGGVAPYLYEIIGSEPSTPVIVAPLQSSPVFNINTATTYSLVRLRTIDGCGNASINDVSVLPLANMIISTQNNCMSNNITLHVDTIPNATYSWYKRIWPSDSVLVGSSVNYNIPILMPSDTGTYICKVLVNNGCMQRVSYFDLKGDCGAILAEESTWLAGKKANDKVQLEWTTFNETGLKEYIVERRNEKDRNFSAIASVQVLSSSATTNIKHLLLDTDPGAGINLYRIRIISQAGKITYSNEIAIKNITANTLQVYPNPATDMISIRFNNREQKEVLVRLTEANGRIVLEKRVFCGANEIINMKRPAGLASGLYFLSVTDSRTGNTTNQNIIFR